MAEMKDEEPLNCEKRLMRLLGLKTLDELNRSLSEPADEEMLEAMAPPYELYDLETQNDLVDCNLQAIEDTENDGTDAIFVTKDGGVGVLRVSNPAPKHLPRQEFSNLPNKDFGKPSELDRCNRLWLSFVRRGSLSEFLIYEEL